MPEVYNKRHKNVPADAVYVGRPSIFGNPFTHLPGKTMAKKKVATAQEAVEAYREWILTQPTLLDLVKRDLKGKDLVCWCAPGPCHGYVLVEIANE